MVAIFQATTDMVSSLKPLVDKHGIHKVGVCVISGELDYQIVAVLC